ncbi:NfeD family protein [Bacillaceae bacterium W0354]
MFFDTTLGVFIITFLALFFLIGEIIVKLKGLGAILGIGFIGLYFSAYLSTFDLILLGSLFAIGLLMIVFDGKVVNDGTIGLLGFFVVLLTVAFAAPNWLLAVYSIAGVILGGLLSLSLLKVLPKRNMWTKITLIDRLTSEKGYNSINNSYKELIGQEGKTLTVLRPSGTILIGSKEYSAVSRGKWIDKDQEIKVVLIDGTKIVVEEK